MADREKVMQWLETCANGCEDGCPYEYKNLVYRVECKADLMSDAFELLKEQESSEWLEDSDPGQEYGTTWACWKCMHSIHKPFVWNPYNSGYKYCPHCGAEMKVKLDAES